MEALEEEVQFLKAENLKIRNNDSCHKVCPNASTLLTHRQGLSEGSHSSIDPPVPQAPPPPPPPPPVPAPPPPPLACLKKNQVVHN
ncbi:PREDICTED: proline-rich protein 11-like [Acropora digitifera]|uniref:proline-rich protein 11-like n=1 Tax=Acropora digitifera TaxID=70779 RepID=UPI00077ACA92|nr:PREDICTED: proline-rich protein 11-like [Acropora digitifera]